MTKAQIIKLGTKLQVPYQNTWSCYNGLSKPCGVCDSCKLRAKGFKEAGLKDPAAAK
jgi:7-cyano-7-deazaguanine synthase